MTKETKETIVTDNVYECLCMVSTALLEILDHEGRTLDDLNHDIDLEEVDDVRVLETEYARYLSDYKPTDEVLRFFREDIPGEMEILKAMAEDYRMQYVLTYAGAILHANLVVLTSKDVE